MANVDGKLKENIILCPLQWTLHVSPLFLTYGAFHLV